MPRIIRRPIGYEAKGGVTDTPILQLGREGQLTLRISIADWIEPPSLTSSRLAELTAARARAHHPMLPCCAAKFLLDGVIESHTAFLPGGYADLPSEAGTAFTSPRNRIEHAEAPDTEDIPRFGRLGVIASMQPLMISGNEPIWPPSRAISSSLRPRP